MDPDLAVNLNPKLAIAYADRGQDYNKNWRYDLAIRDLTKAIELDPSSVSARIFADRGKAYLELGNTALARSDYNKALELDPKIFTGQELTDILFRCSSRAKTASMDGCIDMTLIIATGDVAVNVIIPIKIDGVSDITNKKMRITMTCKIDIPGQDKLGFIGDVYVVDGWQYIHTKYPGTESWVKKEYGDELWETHNQFSQQAELLKTGMDTTLLGSEKIEDVDCYVFLFKPDMATLAKYFENLLSQQQETGVDFSKVDLSKMIKTVEIKEWITREEYLPAKIEGTIDIATTLPEIIQQGYSFSTKDLNLVANIKMQMKFQDFNKPVVIELPPEALHARQIFDGR